MLNKVQKGISFCWLTYHFSSFQRFEIDFLSTFYAWKDCLCFIYTITSILDPSNLSQTPDISSRLSNQFVLYIVNLRQIYPKPLFYPQIPNDRSEYKIEVIVYINTGNKSKIKRLYNTKLPVIDFSFS